LGKGILIVEDDRIVAAELERTLTAKGYEVHGVLDSGEHAVELASRTRPDLVLMDIVLPGSVDGITAAKQLQNLGVPVIYVTAYSDQHLVDRAQHTEPLAFVGKPVQPGDLAAVIQLALFRRDLERERERQQHAAALHEAKARFGLRTGEAPREQGERLGVALQAARTGTWHWELATNIDSIDESLRRLFGLGPDQNIRRIEDFYAIVHPDDRPEVIAAFDRTLKEGANLEIEFRVVWPDGSEHWLLDRGEVVHDADGRPLYMSGACVDITERKQAQEAFRESEARFRLYADNVSDYALLQIDAEGRIVSWNAGAERVLGYSEAEILGQPGARLFTSEDVANEEPQREMQRAVAEGRSADERWHIRKDGTRFWASGVLTPIYDRQGRPRGFAKVMRDETEHRRTDEQIRASLKEKEALLKEIHHRVKNNLQVIISLLGLQSQHISDESTRTLFDEACNRVRAIGRIHELLYNSRDLARVDFEAYLHRLGRDLFSFYGVDRERIRLTIEAGSADLEIDQAIPCALIVNELVTNAVKHAFPGGRSGTIEVSLKGPPERECILVVADDGVGLPEQLNFNETNSLGLQLVPVLAEQLHGRVHLDRSRGTRFEISFPSYSDRA
jgi:PAS domain S-box-containing protein